MAKRQVYKRDSKGRFARTGTGKAVRVGSTMAGSGRSYKKRYGVKKGQRIPNGPIRSHGKTLPGKRVKRTTPKTGWTGRVKVGGTSRGGEYAKYLASPAGKAQIRAGKTADRAKARGGKSYRRYLNRQRRLKG